MCHPSKHTDFCVYVDAYVHIHVYTHIHTHTPYAPHICMCRCLHAQFISKNSKYY